VAEIFYGFLWYVEANDETYYNFILSSTLLFSIGYRPKMRPYVRSEDEMKSDLNSVKNISNSVIYPYLIKFVEWEEPVRLVLEASDLNSIFDGLCYLFPFIAY
jgi:hypothetical protein